MFSTAEKTTRSSATVQQKTERGTFFRKATDEPFFGAKESGAFFSAATVQPKLTVSSPDDPQEREADEVAGQVMRMTEPAPQPEKKEEEKVQAKEEGVERSGALLINSTEIKPEKKERVQTKLFTLHRSEEEAADEGATANAGCDCSVHAKSISLHRSDVLQQSGRGPPARSPPFEQSLQSTKGSGSPLPADTRQFMETRFGADFSAVRIHTGTASETLNRTVHAQAFTHGADIYFNAGKWSPQTEGGGLLLAHELTHTIQQGAISHSTSSASIARKHIIQRSPDGNVPSQLTNAVEKAKTQEGKINANKEGPDGFRIGWEALTDIFKTTFGEDKITGGSGGATVQGAVSEEDIKKKRIQKNALVVDPASASGTKYGERDAMPSWCGIFVFWALNKSGVPMPKWQLGRNVMKREAAYPPGYTPRPGDIAYRAAYSHFAIVESSSGGKVRTVNGNTAGEDNLGGQVQTREHPIANWSGFFNPLLIMEGSLGSGEGPTPEKPKPLEELRKEIFGVSRKEEGENEGGWSGEEDTVQTKPEKSNWHVDAGGGLVHTTPASEKKIELKEEKKEEEEKNTAIAPSTVQKKEFDTGYCHDTCTNEQEETSFLHFSPAGTTNLSTSSLNGYTPPSTESMSAEQDRGPPVQTKAQNDALVIQRSVIDDALSYIGSVTDCISLDLDEAKRCGLQKAQEVALHIPGYRALRVVLGSDPITGQHIERNGRNFIEAAFDVMPGGSLLHQKLDEIHLLDSAAEWIDRQIAAIETIVNNVYDQVSNFWNSLGVSDFTSPMEVLRRGANIVLGFINSVIDFAVNAAGELLKMVKDYLLAKIVDFIKEQTPAYPLLTVILGKDPITDQKVERNGTNILNALLELGGEEGRMQRQQMQETGSFQRVAGYIDEGIAVFSGAYDQIVQGFRNVWNIVTIESLMNPVETFRQIYNQFAEPVRRVWNFVSEVGAAILRFIKEVLMRRLSQWAQGVRGYRLVTVLLGKDPFTDEAVPRTIENIIRGFMSLMEGGEEQYQQMVESGAIGRAAAQIRAAVARLNMTPAYIVQLFTDLWNSFSLNDLANPIAAFQRILDRFGEPIGRLIAFVIEIVKIVIRVILEIMNFPFDLINNIITRAMAAFERIKRDPIGFLKNLLRAIKQGFIQFFDNIVTHLINGVVGWLMSELRDANVPAPTDFSLRGIIGWVLQVLGISMEAIWQKLAAHPRIGPQRVARIRGMINTLEGIWTFIKDVQERGVAAIWDKIQEQLSNLWNTVLDAVKNWIMERIITQVTARLLSMLDPTGIMAVINSAVAIYNAVQSFIRYLRQMLEVVNSFVNGVADIAEGNITTAANYLENTMDRAMPIVIGFLANQVGLSGVGRRVGEMIGRAREMVDQALTWLVNRAVDTAFNLIDRLMGRGSGEAGAVGDVRTRARIRLNELITENDTEAQIQTKVQTVLNELRPNGLTGLRLISDTQNEGEFFIDAAASPGVNIMKLIPKLAGRRPTARMVADITAEEDISFVVTSHQINQTFQLENGTSVTLPKTYPVGQRLAKAEVRTIAGSAGKTSEFASIERSGGSWTVGGAILIPQPGDQRIQVAAWNTDTNSFESGSNQSHAEYQFKGWLRSQGEEFLSKIKGISVEINLSPCDDCCGTLNTAVSELPALKPDFLRIGWSQAYCKAPMPHRRTTQSGLATLTAMISKEGKPPVHWDVVQGRSLIQDNCLEQGFNKQNL